MILNRKLRNLCLQSQRLQEVNYADFKREIGSIEIHGLEQYFLDMLDKNIKVSNGCNSSVAYLIGITDEKPLRSIDYKGGSIPDIDLDFPRHKREDVIQYIKDKYKTDYVANIGTYGKMYAKSAVRYAGKALGYPIELVDSVAKLIPDPVQGVNWSVEEAVEENSELRSLSKTNKDVAEILKWASKLEGTLSNRSKHAAGIIISAQPIDEIASVWRDEDTRVIEFNMSESENMGFVKMDILGLKTLDIIDDTIKLIKKNHNIDITPEQIPLDDEKTFKLLGTGNLMGVFQLEASGISGYTKKFKPHSLMDVTLISAGYRPGPLQFMPSILDVKHNTGVPAIKPHSARFPILKEILKETYG